MAREESNATEPDPIIGTFVGEYRVERLLGEGGMATVYAAVHPLIGKKAAIKVMTRALSVDPSAMVRFVQEARAVNQIGHPNIVDVFSFGRLYDGRSYFVMEWLQGETLWERMTSRAMGLEECVEVVDQICDALEAAHDKGIIHRDIKPANVFLVPVRGRPDQVKLLDFGVAKLAPREMTARNTRTGFVVGTPDYISPEQARGRDVNSSTDVYALGVVAYEMVLGRLPFSADNPMDMVRMHMTEPPVPPRQLWPDVPAALEELLLAMLDKVPANRPSLPEVRQRLAGLRVAALSPLGPPPPRRRLVDPRQVQIALGTAALLCGAILLLVLGLRAPLKAAAARPPSLAGPMANAAPAPLPSALIPPVPVLSPRELPPVDPSRAPTTRTRTRHPHRAAAGVDRDYLVDPFAIR